MSHEPLDYFTPPAEDKAATQYRVVRRIRRVFGFIALAAFIFAGANSSDRNPLQWPAAFVFMGCLAVYFIAILVSWAAHGAVAVSNRRRSKRAT